MHPRGRPVLASRGRRFPDASRTAECFSAALPRRSGGIASPRCLPHRLRSVSRAEYLSRGSCLASQVLLFSDLFGYDKTEKEPRSFFCPAENVNVPGLAPKSPTTC